MTEELKKYPELIMSLSLDYEIGKISLEHYLDVLKLCIKKMESLEIKTT
jgi:hypothetical protein